MFDFEAKADSPNRHRRTRYRYLWNFQKPNVIQYILASFEFGVVSSLAMRPAWRQMRATMKYTE
jgi:hypothetical protein